MPIHNIPGKANNVQIMSAALELTLNKQEVGGLYTAERIDDTEDTSYTRDVLKLIDQNAKHFVVTLPLRSSLNGPIVLKRSSYKLLELPRLSEDDLE